MKGKYVGMAIIVFSLVLLVVLSVVKSNIDAQEVFLCEEVHKDPTVDMAQCPAHTSNNSWLMIAAFGIVFAMLAFGVYLVLVPAQTEESSHEVNDIDVAALDEEERKIVQLLQESSGSAYQSDLVKATEWSKVKVTRVLDKLEQKSLIDRRRRGMANLIILK